MTQKFNNPQHMPQLSKSFMEAMENCNKQIENDMNNKEEKEINEDQISIEEYDESDNDNEDCDEESLNDYMEDNSNEDSNNPSSSHNSFSGSSILTIEDNILNEMDHFSMVKKSSNIASLILNITLILGPKVKTDQA